MKAVVRFSWIELPSKNWDLYLFQSTDVIMFNGLDGPEAMVQDKTGMVSEPFVDLSISGQMAYLATKQPYLKPFRLFRRSLDFVGKLHPYYSKPLPLP